MSKFGDASGPSESTGVFDPTPKNNPNLGKKSIPEDAGSLSMLDVPDANPSEFNSTMLSSGSATQSYQSSLISEASEPPSELNSEILPSSAPNEAESMSMIGDASVEGTSVFNPEARGNGETTTPNESATIDLSETDRNFGSHSHTLADPTLPSSNPDYNKLSISNNIPATPGSSQIPDDVDDGDDDDIELVHDHSDYESDASTTSVVVPPTPKHREDEEEEEDPNEHSDSPNNTITDFSNDSEEPFSSVVMEPVCKEVSYVHTELDTLVDDCRKRFEQCEQRIQAVETKVRDMNISSTVTNQGLAVVKLQEEMAEKDRQIRNLQEQLERRNSEIAEMIERLANLERAFDLSSKNTPAVVLPPPVVRSPLIPSTSLQASISSQSGSSSSLFQTKADNSVSGLSSSFGQKVYTYDDLLFGRFPSNASPLLLDDQSFVRALGKTKEEFLRFGKVKQYREWREFCISLQKARM